ncbi:NADH dehydrogenase subunit 2 (mitochondrion) [Agrilus planipennis]|uniref:NADH-ubiquinone oxidoreductase chain 2 n=1 Tax=Agrilus planipennis TaxID=224129 RepID=A0A1B0VG58_AGRPL|nr:NADH dehydrogenase subunit 2 [Agrilus planipennis]AMV73985.1 NADH dehydrogenase subunit 2 [Agrilus planipennis]
MSYLYKNLFIITLMTGTLISISSESWLGVWIGLEMNLLSIIPLMNNSKDLKSTEASLKYFIVQAMASMILLMGFLINTIKINLPNNLLLENLPSSIITTSLMIKTGAAPFHFWFPEVMEGLNWMNALIMLTWQKIAPMTIIMYTHSNEILITTVIMFSVITGGLMGINQTSLRKIMSYSSINHIGWMMAALLFTETLWKWYFLIYSAMNMAIIWMLSKFNISSIPQLMAMSKNNPKMKTFFMFNFFSLGGLPPFIGFLPKWLTIQVMVLNEMYLTGAMMIIITLITLYFYMRITMPLITLSSSSSSLNLSNQQFKSKNMMSLNSILLTGLLFSTMAFNWI